jgi:hypothetical protein
MYKMYTAYAINDQGASVSVGIDMDHINGGRKFTSKNSAKSAARRELGSGWEVHIIDENGREVDSFKIR